MPNESYINRTYQRRGYCSKEGYARIDRVLAECANLWNVALEHRKTAYKKAGVSISRNVQSKEFTAIVKEDAFWGSGISRRVGIGVLDRLDKAFQAFFRRVKEGETPGFPRFKSARRWHTIEPYPEPSMTRMPGRLKIRGLPPIRYNSGGLPEAGQVVSIRITRRFRRLTVNLTYKEPVPAPLPATGASVGIDRGISDRLALSNGENYPRRRKSQALRRKEQRLARCRHPERGVKGSRRYRERRKALDNAQARERIANRNACHRMTPELVRQFDIIGAEQLAIRNMTRSAAGTLEKPGSKVKQKSGLNREILAQTWGLIATQLTYKAEWAGKKVVPVDPKFPSQRCSECSYIDRQNRKGKRFTCLSCGFILDADVNAARNIAALAAAGGKASGADPHDSGPAIL